MKITNENYKSWLLRLWEEQLSPSEQEELDAFLAMHPNLDIELPETDLPHLQPDNETTFDKTALKKEPFDDRDIFEQSAVAYTEGDMNPTELSAFELWLKKSPQHTSELKHFAAARLKPDSATVFPNKNKLKKRATIIPLWVKAASVAATLIIAFLVLKESNQPQRPAEKQIAETATVPTENAQPLPENRTITPKQEMERKPSNQPKTATALPEKRPSPSTDELLAEELIIKELRHADIPNLDMLPAKTVVFELVDELRTAAPAKATAPAENVVELSQALEPQLAAIRKSGDNEYLSGNHIGLTGLQLLAKLSGERLQARQTASGEVKAIRFNSKLLAFTIPVNR